MGDLEVEKTEEANSDTTSIGLMFSNSLFPEVAECALQLFWIPLSTSEKTTGTVV